jgi:hypothetical protein
MARHAAKVSLLPAGSGKGAATREGGTGIGMDGAGNLGSVPVGSRD